MFSDLKLTNFAAFSSLDWPNHAPINVIIGENDSGKTHLIKILYCIGRSINEFQKSQSGPMPRPWAEILSHKLLWTFQPQNFELGQLVRNGAKGLRVETRLDDESFFFSIGERVTKKITNISESSVSHLSRPVGRVLFLPPKEVLTAWTAIEATRRKLEIQGFDDTYLDLIDDFRLATSQGSIARSLMRVRSRLEEVTGGGEIVEDGGEFIFRRGRERFTMAQTAEGIKKIGILSRLIRNRNLAQGSILLVDEPEANLHPVAIIAMAEMLFELGQDGVQVYATTHNYFFLKRMEQLARAKKHRVTLVDLRRSPDGVMASFHDLRDEIPDNPIIAQSEFLLNEDIRLDWGKS